MAHAAFDANEIKRQMIKRDAILSLVYRLVPDVQAISWIDPLSTKAGLE